MSADSWSKCPKCRENQEKAAAKLVADIAAAKAAMDFDRFAMLLEKSTEQAPKLKETLREDWEIGIWNAEGFEVSYGACCTVCGFRYNFKFSDPSLEHEE